MDELRLDNPTGLWPGRGDEISPATAVASDPQEPPISVATEEPESDSTFELDAEGGPRRRGLARKLITHGLPVALLRGVIAWTLNERGSITTDRGGRHPNNGGGVDVTGDMRAPDAGLVGPSVTAEDDDEPEAAPLGKNIRKLLSKVDLLRVVPPEGTVTVRLHNEHVLAPRTVTVINLWATFCEPCKRELPALKGMFEAARGRWGGKVRFVPIQVDDPADSIFSYAQFADKMPPTDAFLVDTGVGGGVRPPLVAAGVIPRAWSFQMLVRLRGDGARMKAGRYRFEGPYSMLDVEQKLATGDIERREITFPEGRNMFDMAEIAGRSGLSAERFLAAAKDVSAIADLDPLATSLEGYLFPETYDLQDGMAETALTAAMVKSARR